MFHIDFPNLITSKLNVRVRELGPGQLSIIRSPNGAYFLDNKQNVKFCKEQRNWLTLLTCRKSEKVSILDIVENKIKEKVEKKLLTTLKKNINKFEGYEDTTVVFRYFDSFYRVEKEWLWEVRLDYSIFALSKSNSIRFIKSL